ncbi:class III extradiol ring-cleavage dioxygenase family protein [Cellulomonas alba]|uniref:Extradiol ring-cleavage dioxygenase class III enzyme subunit B domain-containing protein n=1 Tax=Cellulomonas alba TaxID=3053467 RepID=A0ABT7SJE4_9CELL|nr:hypothetical protein [Cellulomonas alba]MDM7856159.1 hypothetical protein [Cellulomonas alba]
MLVAAALVPDTALLVPGVAGAADPARTLAVAAARAVEAATREADVVVVVAPGPTDRELVGDVPGTFAPVGVPDRALRAPLPVLIAGADAPDGGPPTSTGVPAPATAVAIHLLAGAGCTRARLVEVARGSADGRADRLHALGRELAGSGTRRTALVVVGSASGRHGPDAPLADDPRAPGYDAELLAGLAQGGEEARARLATLDAALAVELAVTGWAPWQVLVGAAAATAVAAELVHAEVLAGAQHAVLLWRCA